MSLVDTSTGEIEQVTLEDLEEIVGRGLETFTEVGEALAKIRDGKLYLDHASTFESYCKVRWGLSRSRSYQLIEAAEVAESMSTMVDTPQPEGERQARALAPLKNDPPKMAAAMQAASDATDGKPTAAAIKEAVADLTEPTDREKAQERLDDLLDDEEMRKSKRLQIPAKAVASMWAQRALLDEVHPDDFSGDQLRELQGLSESLARFVGATKAERKKLTSIAGGKA